MTEPSDQDVSWSLILRAAAGDRAARSRFGRSYLPVVRGFLKSRWRSTPLSGDVDDAVQEVFVECLRENGVLARADPSRGDLRGFLYGVTRKVAARFEERAGRELTRDCASESALEAIQAREPSLSAVFDREWARTLVRMAGDRMRVLARGAGAELRIELLRLRFAEGLPIRDIAARWETDPDALYRAYGKARSEFKDCLRRVIAEHAVRSELELDREVDRVLDLLG